MEQESFPKLDIVLEWVIYVLYYILKYSILSQSGTKFCHLFLIFFNTEWQLHLWNLLGYMGLRRILIGIRPSTKKKFSFRATVNKKFRLQYYDGACDSEKFKFVFNHRREKNDYFPGCTNTVHGTSLFFTCHYHALAAVAVALPYSRGRASVRACIIALQSSSFSSMIVNSFISICFCFCSKGAMNILIPLILGRAFS